MHRQSESRAKINPWLALREDVIDGGALLPFHPA